MGFWENTWIPTLSGNKLNDVNGDVNLKVSYVISNGSWDMKYVCANALEKIEHLLLLCDWAKLAWFCYPLKAFVFLMCGLKMGCEVVFHGAKADPFLAVDKAVRNANEFYVSNKGFSPVSGYVVNKGVGNAQVDDSWVAPGTDLLKCNVDGTFPSGFAVGGVGIICINALGEVLDGCAEKLLTCSSLLIESWALKKALLLACLKGWERVVFESDCAVLVDAVVGLKGAKTSRPSSCRLVSEEGVKRVVMKDCVFNPPPSLASILTFNVTRSSSNIGDRSSNSCFSARLVFHGCELKWEIKDMAKQKGGGRWMSIGRAWIQALTLVCLFSLFLPCISSMIFSPSLICNRRRDPSLLSSISVIVTVKIHHRCRRYPSSSLSRSVTIVIEIRHRRHRDTSSLSSKSVIVAIEIHHRCCRDPSPSPLMSSNMVEVAQKLEQAIGKFVEHGASFSTQF
ncbi:reverse transcriptase [Senna tora]|uniref:Reverse transcriptase n=1 Tax=Senna tora TaxID=362788 RepID=A0A834XD26_9FABA|nr:reverse transcriptase [Senna tora]